MSWGQVSYWAWQIWSRLDNVCSSYNNFLFYSEKCKMSAAPRQWRVMESRDFHQKASSSSRDFSKEIWGGPGQPAWRSTSKYKTCYFLSPGGGMWRLGQIGPLALELQTIYCFMAKHGNLVPRHGHTVSWKVKLLTTFDVEDLHLLKSIRSNLLEIFKIRPLEMAKMHKI